MLHKRPLLPTHRLIRVRCGGLLLEKVAKGKAAQRRWPLPLKIGTQRTVENGSAQTSHELYFQPLIEIEVADLVPFRDLTPYRVKCRVGVAHCCTTPPEERCMNVSPHTAQAFQKPVAGPSPRFFSKTFAIRRYSRRACFLMGCPLSASQRKDGADAPSRGNTTVVICLSACQRFSNVSCNERPVGRGPPFGSGDV